MKKLYEAPTVKIKSLGEDVVLASDAEGNWIWSDEELDEGEW